MERIASFSIDHRLLREGIYLSRRDGDVDTYDLRMRRPNGGDYLSNPAIHTVEHLFATFVRNSRFKAHILYFGPMGCRTGFYFLVCGMTGEEVISLVQEGFRFISAFSGEIPGASEPECGNYREHDLAAAKADAVRYLACIDGYTPERLCYPTAADRS